MKISPGDTLQIFLTVDGVPYAKTHVFTHIPQKNGKCNFGLWNGTTL